MSRNHIVPSTSTVAERRLAEAFVELANTLMADFDAREFLSVLADKCVELLGVDSVGVLLTDQLGHVQVMAASSEQTRLLALFQLQNREGPCFECFHTGKPADSEDLSTDDKRWPRFAPQARTAGFAAVQALPMRSCHEVIGALNLFHTNPRILGDDATSIAQALVDVAAIGLLRERAIRDRVLVIEQLQTALSSRIIIEQAKGLLAEHRGISVDEAFAELRRYSRSRNQRLSDTARAVVEHSPSVTALTDPLPPVHGL